MSPHSRWHFCFKEVKKSIARLLRIMTCQQIVSVENAKEQDKHQAVLCIKQIPLLKELNFRFPEELSASIT